MSAQVPKVNSGPTFPESASTSNLAATEVTSIAEPGSNIDIASDKGPEKTSLSTVASTSNLSDAALRYLNLTY